MEVRDLPAGQDAPDDVDSLQLNKLPSGRFSYILAVAVSEREVSFGKGTFETRDQAREQGILHAEQDGADVLYIVDKSAI